MISDSGLLFWATLHVDKVAFCKIYIFHSLYPLYIFGITLVTYAHDAGVHIIYFWKHKYQWYWIRNFFSVE